MTEQTQDQNILIFKLASGEEVMARAAMDEISVYLQDPVQLVTYPDETSRTMKVGFVPFAPYSAEGGVCLSRIGTHLIMPNEEMVRSYRSFTSGIELPSSKIQL